MELVLRGPKLPLQASVVAALPVSLGVYIVTDFDGEILRIGYAGSRSLFGLRSAVGDYLDTPQRSVTGDEAPQWFQVEVNVQYWARWRELLIRYFRRSGRLPPGNDPSDLEGVFARVPGGGGS